MTTQPVSRVTGPFSGLELANADDVLEGVALTIAKMKAIQNHPVFKGPHLANMTQLERDFLNQAKWIFGKIEESITYRENALRQSQRKEY